MKLSTKARYGLRAFIDLAVYSEDGPVSLTMIARRQDISVSYLEQLVGKLKRAGLVESVRGASGGYVLARSADTYSVGEVLRALEEELVPVDCAGITGKPDSHCVGQKNCLSRIVWERINESINQTVDSICIGDLLEENKRLNLEEELS